MAEIRITAPAPDHDQIGAVGDNDHHALLHAIDSALVHSGVITDTQHGARTVALAHLHSALDGIGATDHQDAPALIATHAALPTDHQDAPALIATHTAIATAHGTFAVVVTGSYTGDGGTSQGISGLGIAPVVVFIAQRVTGDAQVLADGVLWTVDTMIDDNAAGMAVNWDSGAGDTEMLTNKIIALGSDGFTVDDAMADINPNTNGIVYNFWALGA